jgi:hypothetical protein
MIWALQTLKSLGGTLEEGASSYDRARSYFLQGKNTGALAQVFGSEKAHKIANAWSHYDKMRSKMLLAVRTVSELGVRAIDTPPELEFYSSIITNYMLPAETQMAMIDMMDQSIGVRTALEESLGPEAAARIRNKTRVEAAQHVLNDPGISPGEKAKLRSILATDGIKIPEGPGPGGPPDPEDFLRGLERGF